MAAMDTKCNGCSVSWLQCCRKSDSEILQFYVDHGVYSRVRVCGNNHCNNILILNENANFMFRCGKYYSLRGGREKKKCRFAASAKKGTFLEQAKLPLTTIFVLVGTLLISRPPRQELIRSMLSLGSNTIVDWYSFCREVYFHHVSDNADKLGGVGHVVEIDEAKFGKRKYNRARRVEEGQWVFGGIDRGTRQTFLIPVEKRGSETLLGIIRDKILPGTTIISDCWEAYNCLNDEGFVHETVNHLKHFVNPLNNAHTNNIKRRWRDVRDNIPKYGRKKHHFVGYLAEYLFKSKFPHLNDRIHNFWLAVAKLYPPQK